MNSSKDWTHKNILIQSLFRFSRKNLETGMKLVSTSHEVADGCT
jgi:hypothetical protein